MTTTVTIIANGNYVAEGTLTRTPNSGGPTQSEPISVGPGSMVSKDVYFWHDHKCTLELNERPATDEEIAALNKPSDPVPADEGREGDRGPDPA